MKIGLIGLGKMGANLAMNFKDHQHEVIGYDLSEAACESIAEKGIQVAKDMDDLIAKLDKPRVLWLMLPCGGPMDSTIDALSEKLAADDIVIDGGSSRYTDSMQHAKICANKQIRFLDCGTSGGVSGARNGACLMVGGDKSVFDVVKDALADVAVDQGMTYTGKAYNRASITKNEITNITGAAAGAISYEGRDGTIYTQSQTAPTNVGKYAAKVTIGGKTAVANFEITKLTASANVKFAADLTYNGQNQNLVLNATTTGGTLMYRLSDTDEWKAGLVMLTGKDAGDYHI